MIRKLELNEFDTIYELLKQCFPSDEYRTYAQQRALLDNPYYQIYVLSDENKQIKAFMAIFEFEQIAHIRLITRHTSLASSYDNCFHLLNHNMMVNF